MSPVEAGEIAKEVELELKAAPDAPAFSGQLALHVTEPDSGTIHRVVHDLTTVTLNNGVPQGFRDLVIPSTESIWLTVLPASPAKPTETKSGN